MESSELQQEALKREWTDQYVETNAQRPELKRFEELDGRRLVGRVVTVNQNRKAIIDFADGAWYDITASTEFLKKLDPAAAKIKYDDQVKRYGGNSAQPYPEKQG